jgi:hypothetical protein
MESLLAFPVELSFDQEDFFNDFLGAPDPLDILLDESEIIPQVSQSAVFPSMDIEWQYKRGTRKSQQYWVYCEGSQYNYLKCSFYAGNLMWSSDSRIMKYKNDLSSTLIFIETVSCNGKSRGIALEPGSAIGFVEMYNLSDLEEIPLSNFQFALELEADRCEPFHPHQGSAESVQFTAQICNTLEHPAPFVYFVSAQFKNRAEGWFRIKCSMIYENQIYLQSLSEPFMLNNPRLKKPIEFQNIPAAHVKYMFMYNVIPISELIRSGNNLGYSAELVSSLLATSRKLFSSVVYCTKRELPTAQAPAKKKRKL